MQTKFEDLPWELHTQIIENLVDGHEAFEALKKWGSTSSHFRRLLTPRMIQRAKLTENDDSANFIKKIADSNFASSIKILDFCPNSHWGCDTACEYRSRIEGDCKAKVVHTCVSCEQNNVLGPEVEEVLSNLQILPNLEKLEVEFRELPWEWSNDFYKIYNNNDLTSDDGETSEQREEAERTQCWRARMANSFKLIAKNKNATVKKLNLRNLVLKEVSTYSSPEWHRFLNQLQGFEMTLPGGRLYPDEGHDVSAWDEYPILTAKFDKFFFDYLTNVTRFVLHSSAEGKLGPLAPLPLYAGHLPLLRHLELTNIFVSQHLVDIIVERAANIETIVMRDALVWDGDTIAVTPHTTWPIASDNSQNYLTDDYEVRLPFTWATILNAIADSKPPCLTTFDIRSSRDPDEWTEFLAGCSPCEDYEEHEHHEKIAEVTRTFKEQPERFVFNYGHHGDTYKWIEDTFESNNMDEFLRGDDQRAYERLMAIVRENQRSTTKMSALTA